MLTPQYIPRALESKILSAQDHFLVILVTGPRQSGKSTLCRHLFPDYKYVNLENITDRARALGDPVGYLDSLGERAIIDEVQNVPDLLSMIQVRVDEDPGKRFVLTGSCNFTLLNTVTQSLAGRVAQFTLLPFSMLELDSDLKDIPTDRLLYRGLYPHTVICHTDPTDFFTQYYNTYVEKDIRDLLKVGNLRKFDTFMRLLASRAGSELNLSSLAKETGVSAPTVSEWISWLLVSYIIFEIPPYYANLGKRLTKMRKVYFTDTGLLCYLLGIEEAEALQRSPFRGALFENMAMSELVKSRYNAGRDPRISFYRENSGREVDALVPSGSGGFDLYEIKASQTLRPDFYANMQAVAALLGNAPRQAIIYDGPTSAPDLLNIRDI